MKKFPLITLIVLCLLSFSSRATVIYVDSAHVGGTQTGTSWATAFSYFQDGVNAAQAGDSVWVAKGTYKPYYASLFSMKEGVKILGGFLNTHTAAAMRDWQSNATILVGNDVFNYSVIQNFGNQLTAAALLDGFIIANGKAIQGGGMDNVGSSPTISNCIFRNNTGLIGLGGGIYNRNAFPVIRNCVFSNNTGFGIYHTSNNSSTSYVATISGCTFKDNTDFGIYNETSDTFFVSNCAFEHNNGGIQITSPLSSLFVDSSSFTDHINGGGVATYNAFTPALNSAHFNNCSFSGNNANSGGGVLINSGFSSFTDCSFTGNSSYAGTGGVEVSYSIQTTFLRCSFSGNTGQTGGLSVGGGTLSVKECAFSNNSGIVGGMVTGDNVSSFFMDSCNFESNTGNEGGGLCNWSDAAMITNCTFTDNISLFGGGILNNSDSTIIKHCTFWDNGTKETNGYGGKGGGLFNSCIAVSIDSCTFVNNSAIYGGGAMYSFFAVPGGRIDINACIFKENKAYSYPGGAIFSDGEAGIDISKCRFNNNTAGSGGCIYSDNSSIRVTNSLFAKSKVWTHGGAIYTKDGLLKIINCSIVQNDATAGSSLYNLNSDVRISNSIMWGNSNALSIYNNGSSSVEATYSLIQDYPANNALHLLNGTINPMFVDTSGAGNYQLQTGSLCINAGINDSIFNDAIADVQGNSRIMGDTVDMGAYEYLLSPISPFGNDTTICLAEGDSFDVSAQNIGASYLWNTGATTQSISVTSSGTYSVATTNSAGTLNDTIVVIINQAPSVNLGNDTNIAVGSILILDAGNPGSACMWNTGDTTHTISVSTGGTYFVTVTNNNNCSASDTITVDYGLGIVAAPGKNYHWSVSPNPTSEAIQIRIDDLQLLNTTISLTDLSGSILKKVIIKNRSQNIFLGDIPPGIYLLKMQNGETGKIVKQ